METEHTMLKLIMKNQMELQLCRIFKDSDLLIQIKFQVMLVLLITLLQIKVRAQ